ncbi:aldehyde dehydrogenase family protein [Shinella sp.]|uniref:aldehyde dehydrogenase family protein n=1 Tax=Shinella sp. TaxID=1870904 RepID=UPI003F7104CB
MNRHTIEDLASLGDSYIDGRFCRMGDLAASVNPASGEEIGRFDDGGVRAAEAAIAAARDAFDRSGWRRDRFARASVLDRFASRLEARRDEIIALLSRENGKLIPEATIEVDGAITKVRYYAALARVDMGRGGETLPGFYSMTLKEPVGVAGIIVPWNAPVILLVRALAPALAAGCAVVIKAATLTALTTGLVLRCLSEVEGLPDGVVNAFVETGHEGGALLCETPDVDTISFTGSGPTAKRIMAAASWTLKRVNFELGGKSPCIVFADADLDRTIPGLVMAGTIFAGQFCMQGSRFLVQRPVFDEVQDRLVAALKAITVGPASDSASTMGPLINHESVERVDRFLDAASRSADIVLRGEPLDGQGSFIRPSLVRVTDATQPIAQNEIFGPVMTLEVFDGDADAVSLANATRFGLSASIWTTNADTPLRVGRDLRAGTVWVNAHGVILDQIEEGGMGESGIGRLNGVGGLEAFQEIKHVLHSLDTQA